MAQSDGKIVIWVVSGIFVNLYDTLYKKYYFGKNNILKYYVGRCILTFIRCYYLAF